MAVMPALEPLAEAAQGLPGVQRAGLEQGELVIHAERDRVARDVHDVLGHSLTVVSLKADLAERLVDRDPESARAKIAAIRSLTRQSLAEIRGTLADLRDLDYAEAATRLNLQMTALQAAVMAASVANKGQRMAPFVVKQVRDEDGKVLRETEPKSLGEAVTEEEAATITDLMFGSERATWGYDGNGFASKTGTAEHAEGAAPHVWYVAFDPAKDVAVAVVVKNGGNMGEAAYGGQVAGPIGRAVLRAAPAPVEGDK